MVDQLDKVTLVFAEITGVQSFCANSKPQEVISMLSRLFSKFDMLCEQYGVYKLHTIGNEYLVMGYNGKVAKDRRTLDDSILEGYNAL